MIVTGKNLSPDLREQVEVLIGTPVGTVVLDRDFGIDLSFLDMPIGQAANAAAAEIAVKIEHMCIRDSWSCLILKSHEIMCLF